jgi:hypothetical protein
MGCKHYFLVVCFLLSSVSRVCAQEFNCQVKVDAKQTGKLQLTIFDNLEKALNELVNQQRWTDKSIKEHQKIDCSIFILITSYESDFFTGSIQFQSSRPVFGTDMSTPILNINDRSFNFTYTEFQPLNFNPNTFETNVMSVVAFYLYTALGMDADTFTLEGGTAFYEQAQQVASSAQSANASGWGGRGSSGDFNRFNINRDLLSPNFSEFREALYVYHRLGLDVMHNDLEEGKQKIVEAIQLIEANNSRRPNSSLVRTFFDSKANEIQLILNGGPKVDVASVKESLYKMAPVHNRIWKEIKN